MVVDCNMERQSLSAVFWMAEAKHIVVLGRRRCRLCLRHEEGMRWWQPSVGGERNGQAWGPEGAAVECDSSRWRLNGKTCLRLIHNYKEFDWMKVEA